MVARQRWIAFLVLYHLVLAATLIVQWGKTDSTAHWPGMLFAFALPTVQFTWSATVGLILGPSRRVRRWYWLSLLFCPLPLWLVYIATILAHYFVNMSLAVTCVILGLGVVLLETAVGLFAGIGFHTKSLLS